MQLITQDSYEKSKFGGNENDDMGAAIFYTSRFDALSRRPG